MLLLAILVCLFTDMWNMNRLWNIDVVCHDKKIQIYLELKMQAEMVVILCVLIFCLVGQYTISVKWSKPHFYN